MNPWVATALAVLGVLGSIIGARYTSKSTVKAAAVSAEEGAFVRAQGIYEAGQGEMEARIERVTSDLTATRVEVGLLRSSVSQYEARVLQLQEVLRLHGIPVPPWPVMAGPGSVDPNQPPRITDPPGE